MKKRLRAATERQKKKIEIHSKANTDSTTFSSIERLPTGNSQFITYSNKSLIDIWNKTTPYYILLTPLHTDKFNSPPNNESSNAFGIQYHGFPNDNLAPFRTPTPTHGPYTNRQPIHENHQHAKFPHFSHFQHQFDVITILRLFTTVGKV